MANAPAIVDGLTEKQIGFVNAYVANGGKGSEAAAAAGYAVASAHVEAYRLLRTPHVQAALQARLRHEYSGILTLALSKLKSALERDEVKPSVMLDAAVKLGDRLGLGPRSDSDPKDGGKKIEDMTLAELNAFIRAKEAATQAVPPPGVVPSPSYIEGQVTDIEQ